MDLQTAFLILGVDFLVTPNNLEQIFNNKLYLYDISRYAIQDPVLKTMFESKIKACQEALFTITNFDADISGYEPTNFLDLKITYQRRLLSLITNIKEENKSLYKSAQRLIRGYAISMEMARSEEELEELFKKASGGIEMLKSQTQVNSLARTKGGN